jgi:hypothetical protein
MKNLKKTTLITLLILFGVFLTTASLAYAQDSSCSNKLHIIAYDPKTRIILNNWVTDNQRKWLFEKIEEKDKNKKPLFCLVAELKDSDYVFVWTASDQPQSFTINVPVTTTSRSSGSASGYIGRDRVSIDSTSTTDSTVYVPKEVRYSVTYVTGMVLKWNQDSQKYEMISSVIKSGKWRWSKPDKDALVDSLKRISLID